MTAFFDHRRRLKGFRRDKEDGWPLRQNEWREAGGQNQSKRIERPSRGVVVVRVVDFLAAMLGARSRNTFEMRIEMRVDEPGMIVFGSRSLPRVNVLERR